MQINGGEEKGLWPDTGMAVTATRVPAQNFIPCQLPQDGRSSALAEASPHSITAASAPQAAVGRGQPSTAQTPSWPQAQGSKPLPLLLQRASRHHTWKSLLHSVIMWAKPCVAARFSLSSLWSGLPRLHLLWLDLWIGKEKVMSKKLCGIRSALQGLHGMTATKAGPAAQERQGTALHFPAHIHTATNSHNPTALCEACRCCAHLRPCNIHKDHMVHISKAVPSTSYSLYDRINPGFCHFLSMCIPAKGLQNPSGESSPQPRASKAALPTLCFEV